MDDYIGELAFKVTELLDGVPRDDWFSLKTKNGKKSMGELHLQIMYLDKGEDMTKDLEEFTAPLQTLLRKKSFKAWQTMIDQDFDIEKVDSKGRTPLHVCAELNLKDNMQILLKKNADVIAKDQAEQTALHAVRFLLSFSFLSFSFPSAFSYFKVLYSFFLRTLK